jgi:hypothetical protein
MKQYNTQPIAWAISFLDEITCVFLKEDQATDYLDSMNMKYPNDAENRKIQPLYDAPEYSAAEVEAILAENAKLKRALNEIRTFPRSRFPQDIANEALAGLKI